MKSKRAAGKTVETIESVVCSRCHGIGRVSGFDHIANGTCFKCEGRGKVTQFGTKTIHAPVPSEHLNAFPLVQGAASIIDTLEGEALDREATANGAKVSPMIDVTEADFDALFGPYEAN